MSKRRMVVFILVLALLGLAVQAPRFAHADCQITSSAGSDDIVVCADNNDADGINTGLGNDIVTVQAGIEVSRMAGSPIRTESGNDLITNYGVILGDASGINTGAGIDRVDNYGRIETDDSPVSCTPVAGQLCTIYNHSTGEIRANLEVLDTSGFGEVIVYNDGLLYSAVEEGVHLHNSPFNTVENNGTIYGGSSGIEVFPGVASITNSGAIRADNESAIDLHDWADTVFNSGTIESYTLPAIRSGGGADTITNTGSIVGDTNTAQDGLISTEGGNDIIITSGAIQQTGLGYAVEAGLGSDTVTIQGGPIAGLISGDDYVGARGADYDTLVFELTGSQEEIEAFRAAAEAQQPAGGSVTWRGNTYQWIGFETIELRLTTGASLAAPTLIGATLPGSGLESPLE